MIAVIALAMVVGWVVPAITQDDIQVRMQVWSKALGVECLHCHVAGRWTDAAKPTFEFARRMMRMVDGLNAGPLKEVGQVTCWTCHRGQRLPARLPRASWEKVLADHEAEFEGRKDRGLAMSVYAASLGVECSHCHEAGDFAAATKPQNAMVAKMLQIFDEIPKYFDDSRKPVTQCFMCHHGTTKPER